MWSSIQAAVRLIATAVDIAREPSYIVVRPRRDNDARDQDERAA
jgi:hypothetical protein